MEFGWLIGFAVFWFIFRVIREGGETLKKDPRRVHELRDAFAAASPGFRELLDAIDQARQPPTQGSLPARVERVPRRLGTRNSERTDDFVSLESTDEEVVVERTVSRAARREVDLDEESIAIAEKRRAQADRPGEARRVPSGRPAAVPQAVPADATAVAVPHPTDAIRQAIIWREILGPPRSLQDN